MEEQQWKTGGGGMRRGDGQGGGEGGEGERGRGEGGEVRG